MPTTSRSPDDIGRWPRFQPPVGYHPFHPDVSLNFQCNRWFNWIGADSYDEIMGVARSARTYPEWITGFLAAGERARRGGRFVAAGYYDRAAEFFMTPDDERKHPARTRFVAAMRGAFDVSPVAVHFDRRQLSAYDLRPTGPELGCAVVFGGYDSYIEEFLPLIVEVVTAGYRVVAFDGPGQGAALEDSGLPLTPHWERPVAAVLDHFGLDDVTAIGISLGGGLVIRAAAFEPRIRRAVAFDVLDDLLESLAGQVDPRATPGLRLLLGLRARGPLNRIARLAARRKPVAQWGLMQGMHITGTTEPYEFFRAARAMHTHSVSKQVTADVLLLAGAEDHYVPLRQLHRQAAALTGARSVTTRTFTAAESAQNHCQIGNVEAAVCTILGWIETIRPVHDVSA